MYCPLMSLVEHAVWHGSDVGSGMPAQGRDINGLRIPDDQQSMG